MSNSELKRQIQVNSNKIYKIKHAIKYGGSILYVIYLGIPNVYM